MDLGKFLELRKYTIGLVIQVYTNKRMLVRVRVGLSSLVSTPFASTMIDSAESSVKPLTIVYVSALQAVTYDSVRLAGNTVT